jgi:hypothetical protein
MGLGVPGGLFPRANANAERRDPLPRGSAEERRFDRLPTRDPERTLSGLIAALLSAERLLELGSVFEIGHLPWVIAVLCYIMIGRPRELAS